MRKGLWKKLLVPIVLIQLISCAPEQKPSEFSDEWSEERDSLLNDQKSLNDYNFVNRNYPFQQTPLLKAFFQFSSGTFKIKQSSQNKLASIFIKYHREKWKPEFYYNERDDSIVLKARLKKSEDIEVTSKKNLFAVALTDRVPIDLHVAFGAGEGHFNLDGLKIKSADFALGAGDFYVSMKNVPLENLDVSAGVGNAVFDLSGKWNNDLNADFSCGIGDLELLLPENTGVRVEVNGILGNVNAYGMQKLERKVYVNQAYSDSKYQINIDITGALGNITLRTVEK